jgi:hypothetical protein
MNGRIVRVRSYGRSKDLWPEYRDVTAQRGKGAGLRSTAAHKFKQDQERVCPLKLGTPASIHRRR